MTRPDLRSPRAIAQERQGARRDCAVLTIWGGVFALTVAVGFTVFAADAIATEQDAAYSHRTMGADALPYYGVKP